MSVSSKSNEKIVQTAGRAALGTPLKNPTSPEFTDLTKKRKIPGEVHLCLIDRTN
jgi:hypothetical protein